MKVKKPLAVWEVLEKAYPPDAYLILAEVSDMAGFDRSRSADYIIVSLWPSRGLTLTGIELKNSRQDWINELKNPAKAENIFQHCNCFCLLTTNERIALPEEIPPTWGHLNISNNKLKTLKPAPHKPISTLPLSFVIPLLKRASSKIYLNLLYSRSTIPLFRNGPERSKITNRTSSK